MRLETYQTILASGLVPLFYHPDPTDAYEMVAACYRGGAKVVEFTNRGHFAHEVFAEVRKRCLREMPELLLGAGSIQDVGTAALYMQLAADFVVSPLLREDVVLACNRRKVAVLPGVSTSTEIGRAEELGCEIVKIAPGEVLGPDFLRAHRGPCPWTRSMVSGGVSPDQQNLQNWFDAGASCVGMGSKLFSSDIVKNRNWDQLESTVRTVIGSIDQIRKSKG